MLWAADYDRLATKLLQHLVKVLPRGCNAFRIGRYGSAQLGHLIARGQPRKVSLVQLGFKVGQPAQSTVVTPQCAAFARDRQQETQIAYEARPGSRAFAIASASLP